MTSIILDAGKPHILDSSAEFAAQKCGPNQMQVLTAFGGIGLFLVGMLILTDGLRNIAGNSTRRLLARFTTTPSTGIATGALTTAIVQSSSATIVAAIGFVGAGLLTFPQALGIILGANIGTTVTGWLIAILGFKLQLGLIAQPLILLGVMLRLFARGYVRHLGWALAGFGLLFVAIELMKSGMTPWQNIVTPDILPGDSWFGRLQLVLIGMTITVVTQSSSAGVAVALVALGTGSIALPQAAAMVIGMDIGTTFTAALATIGGSTASRQTGFAHVIYNILTGVMAYLLLDAFGLLANALVSGSRADDQIALVAFHTGFNTLGAIVALPLARPFADLITGLIPEKGPRLLRRLDDRLLTDPAVAVETVAATVRDVTHATLPVVSDLLDPRRRAPVDPERLANIDQALEKVSDFVGRIRTDPAQVAVHGRHVATLHVLDHLIRLSHRCKQTNRIDVLRTDQRLGEFSGRLRNIVTTFETDELAGAEKKLNHLRGALRKERHGYRLLEVETASQRGLGTEQTIARLNAVRWLHRVTYHYWRIALHLKTMSETDLPSPTTTPVPSDAEETLPILTSSEQHPGRGD